MCELFGVSSAKTVQVNAQMKTFVSHSENHPHGWGIALLLGNYVSLEKEPIKASKSVYLKERLKGKMEVKDMIAHIRLATRGTMEYENSHPFIARDCCGRIWALAHNGTIFESKELAPYIHKQSGRTDSERILCYIVDQMNKQQEEKGAPLAFSERFSLLEQIVGTISVRNKVNLLFYDGEAVYVHTNYRNSLYVHQTEDTAYFATVPLTEEDWRPLPFTTLCAYKAGKEICRGRAHGHEYIDNEHDQKYLFADFSEL